MKVSWSDHAKSVNYRGALLDRAAGEGELVQFLIDHEGQVAAIVQVGNRFAVVRLSELRTEPAPVVHRLGMFVEGDSA